MKSVEQLEPADENLLALAASQASKWGGEPSGCGSFAVG
jgi:hypothetical protein